jgi:hypothetical protein
MLTPYGNKLQGREGKKYSGAKLEGGFEAEEKK